ncbi:mif4g domain-containing protein [Cyclospora cayetanensis]|uniref:Mif4g domain-containing protein n=1 Tax=Cyclospora cayetanensis TaxID=88456 RepID=A0A1D3CYB6_9EIME|nr:mif4g domain-containing protein [Cyclospora cayetanensis]
MRPPTHEGEDGPTGGEGMSLRPKGTEKNFSRIQKALNRIKHLTEKESRPLLDEIRALNLDLFLSELATALAEVDCKPPALRTAAEVVVALAASYSEFPSLFFAALNKNICSLSAAFASAADVGGALPTSFAESSALLAPDVAAKHQQLSSRLRLLLRFLADLHLTSLLPATSLEPLLLQLLLLVTAAPPLPTDKRQEQQQQVYAAVNAAPWPALSSASLRLGSSSTTLTTPPASSRAGSAASLAVEGAAAAGGVAKDKWLYSVPLCLLRLQALGGVFSPGTEAAATTRATAENGANGPFGEGAAAAAASSAETAGSFDSTTPEMLCEAMKVESLSLEEAEEALAALRAARDPPLAWRSQMLAALENFYSGAVVPTLHAIQRELLQQEVQNMQQTIDRGSVSSEGLSRFAALSEKHRAALQHATALAELLQRAPPDAAEIEQKAAATIQGASLVLTVTRLGTEGPGAPSSSSAPAVAEDRAWKDKEERVLAFAVHLLGCLLALFLRSSVGSGDGAPLLMPLRSMGCSEASNSLVEQQASATAAHQTKSSAPKSSISPAVAAVASDVSAALNVATAAPQVAGTLTAAPIGTDAGGASMAAILSRLSQATTQKQIDQIAVDFFIERLNNRPNRTALARALLHVPKTQLHLLPCHARLLAILRKPLKEETALVLDALQADLKLCLDEHDPSKIDSKVKSIRYVCECTKFRLFPPGLVLTAFSALLEDLTPHRIEMLAHFAAGCGSFLLHSRLTGERFRSLVMRMLRLSAARHLPPEQECLIQDVYYQLCGGEGDASSRKQTKEPLQLFLEKLIFADLYGSEEEADAVAKICRKLPWTSDPHVLPWFRDCVLELGFNTKFQFLHRHAALLSALAKYIPAEVISCIDSLLEDIQYGMENEEAEEAPRRLMQARLLGELYNYRLVDSSVLFDALYALIGFGGHTAFQAGNIRTTHRLLFEGARFLQQPPQQETAGGWATAAVYEQRPLPLLAAPDSPEDPPLGVTRLKMVLQILEASGKYFSSGKSKLKLDRFILFFERYCRHKAKTARVDLGEMYDTVQRLRPHHQKLSTPEEADAAAAKLLQEEAAILQSLGEGPVEEFRDQSAVLHICNFATQESALYGDSEESEAEEAAEVEALQPDNEMLQRKGRKDLSGPASPSEEEEVSDGSFDAEFAAAMEEAAEEARATRQTVQPPVRLSWVALKDLPLVGDAREVATGAARAAAAAGPISAVADGEIEEDKRENSSHTNAQESSYATEAGAPTQKPSRVTVTQHSAGSANLYARIEKFVLESVMGAESSPKYQKKRSKAAVRAANSRIPGMAEPETPKGAVGASQNSAPEPRHAKSAGALKSRASRGLQSSAARDVLVALQRFRAMCNHFVRLGNHTNPGRLSRADAASNTDFDADGQREEPSRCASAHEGAAG